MRSRSVLIGGPLLIVLVAPSAILAADSSNDHASPSIAAQPNDNAPLRVPAGQPSNSSSLSIPARQPGESAALEIGRQPSAKVPAPDSRETQEQRVFRQSRQDEIARLNRNFHPHDLEDSHRPYLGLDLEYTTQCYLGREEHGFEVVSVYPNSPAARAGLIGRTGSTPKGDLGALGSILLGPVALLTFPLLRDSGALGTPGDLIVAVDDVRVRTKDEILHALGHLKPGDTTYITVIRPLAGGYHRTMRIALHIDYETDAAGNKIPLAAASPGAAPSPATESAAN
ncbi:MAG: PDZ domain-containing protein [Candidatus Binatus sp.]